MNSYAISLTGSSQGGYSEETMVKIRKALGYAVLFGQNVNFVPTMLAHEALVTGSPAFAKFTLPDNYAGLGSNSKLQQALGTLAVVTFDLDFSLSNIADFWNIPQDGLGVIAVQTVYDTTCQSVKEYVDKPYAIKGYMAVCSGFDASKDLDNFIRFRFYDGATDSINNIYIGKCNSSKTDFYTPFEDKATGGFTLIDPNATFEKY